MKHHGDDSKPTRAVAYLRVSTSQQADHGISLDAQRAKIEAYCELYDIDLVAVEVDAGQSAKTLDRPALQRALAMLRDGEADALLVVKLDRLTRSVRHLGKLVDEYFAGGRFALLSVSEKIDTRSAAGRLVLNVLASVAQWEREIIGERTSEALRHKASLGEFTGGKVPLGHRLAPCGIRLEEDPDEMNAIKLAQDLRREGYSLRNISRELRRRGYVSRSGKPYDPKTVSRMVDSAEREAA